MELTISGKVIAMLTVQLVFSLALPIGLLLAWKKKYGLKMRAFMMGFVAFLVFALLGQQVLHMLVFDTSPAVGAFVESRPWLNALYVGLAAGLFEETGRFLMFKTALRDDKEREYAVAYALGHGGFECFVALGLSVISNLIMAVTLNSGGMAEMIAAMPEAELAVLTENVTLINGVRFSAVLLSVLERVCMLVLHIALSVLVFTAWHQKKMWLLPLAILFHAGVELVSAMYQVGLVQLWMVELLLILYVVAVSIPALRLYRSLPTLKAEKTDQFGRPVAKKK